MDSLVSTVRDDQTGPLVTLAEVPLLGDSAHVLRGHGVLGPESGVEGAAGPGAHNIHLQAIQSV